MKTEVVGIDKTKLYDARPFETTQLKT